MAQTGKVYIQRERRLLSEYTSRNYPRARVVLNQRLGPYPLHAARAIPPGSTQKALSSFRRYVDALIIEPGQVTLLEAKIMMQPSAIAALMLYKRLIGLTPELAPWSHLPVKSIIVAAIADPELAKMASEFGIETIVFTPAWIFEDLMATEFNTGTSKLKSTVPTPTLSPG